MDFTGERYVPDLDGQIKYEHLHRYAICLQLVVDKSVLDIASGEGYGSALLARIAQSVVGVDILPQVVDYAAKEYSSYENLQFMVGSCDAIPLPDQSVDIVTSFETIEHHDQHTKMMQEIKRVLKPGGLLVISSPNRLTYSDEPNYSNPFHVKELYYDELVNLLNCHFSHVKIYGQRLSIGSFIFPLENVVENSFKAYTGSSNYLKQQVSHLNSPLYFVAICSDRVDDIQPSSLDSVYIDEADDLWLQNNQRIAQIETELGRSQSHLQQTQLELERSQIELERSQSHLQQTQLKLERSQIELERSQSHLQQTQLKLERSQERIRAMESSKFWKLRDNWFRLKKKLGVKNYE